MKVYKIWYDLTKYTLISYNGVSELVEDETLTHSKQNHVYAMGGLRMAFLELDGALVKGIPAKKANIYKGIGGFYFDNKSLNIFKDLLDDSCELLEAVVETDDYHLLHLMEEESGYIDYSQSEIEWHDYDRKRAKIIRHLVFDDSKIQKNIFKLKETTPDIYVTDNFYNRYIENELSGLVFSLVYDSEKK